MNRPALRMLHLSLWLCVGALLMTACDRLGLGAPRQESHSASSQPEADEKTAQITVWSDRVEIFLEHRLLVVNTPTKFTTHVTDLTTLEPRRDGPLTYIFQQGTTPPITHVESIPERAGIYNPALTFPQPGEWSVTLQMPLAGQDHRVALPPVLVFASRAEAMQAPEQPEPEGITFLRACLKRSHSRCETPHHKLNHGDSDPRLRGLRQGLKVFTEPPRAIEPAKRAFDDPTPLQHVKALAVPGTFHDHQSPLQHRRHPCDELASVPSVSPDDLQSRKAGHECPEHRFGPIAVLNPRRMYHHDEEQPEDIDHDVALAPADALASIIAPGPPFSVVFTVWLSIIPALGSRVRPEASRRSPRKVSCIRSQTPARRQVQK